jgi:hypothetical protein
VEKKPPGEPKTPDPKKRKQKADISHTHSISNSSERHVVHPFADVLRHPLDFKGAATELGYLKETSHHVKM